MLHVEYLESVTDSSPSYAVRCWFLYVSRSSGFPRAASNNRRRYRRRLWKSRRLSRRTSRSCDEWVGTTDGLVNATIRAQVTGYLIRQNYKEGDPVKKGQMLFEIDPRPFQAALDQAQRPPFRRWRRPMRTPMPTYCDTNPSSIRTR